MWEIYDQEEKNNETDVKNKDDEEHEHEHSKIEDTIHKDMKVIYEHVKTKYVTHPFQKTKK